LTRYGCVVADPPWYYQKDAGRGVAENHYRTIPTSEICALTPPAAKDAHLYMWVTSTHLLQGDARQVCEAWGFEPKQLLTWIKSGNIGLGYYFRNTTEHVIFAVRGSLPVILKNLPTHFTAPRMTHSEKPDALLNIAERMSPGPYLEMFARRRRDGWDVFGDEAPTAAQMVVGL
jgi:N6-adenosine-specific RNA methylase IME4